MSKFSLCVHVQCMCVAWFGCQFLYSISDSQHMILRQHDSCLHAPLNIHTLICPPTRTETHRNTHVHNTANDRFATL